MNIIKLRSTAAIFILVLTSGCVAYPYGHYSNGYGNGSYGNYGPRYYQSYQPYQPYRGYGEHYEHGRGGYGRHGHD